MSIVLASLQHTKLPFIIKIPVYKYMTAISPNFLLLTIYLSTCFLHGKSKLEDLKVLKHSPDLLNNVEIGLGQLRLIMKHILFYHTWG